MDDHPVFAFVDDCREGRSFGRAATAAEALELLRLVYSDSEARSGGWEWAGAEMATDIEIGVDYPRSDADRAKIEADACRYHGLTPPDLRTAGGSGNAEIQYIQLAWVGVTREIED